MNKLISVENLGPIAKSEFSLNSPGVTVLVAPNGTGKTILLEAVAAAARGEGKLPLRDRTKRGKVEAFGATITIGGTCRHTGGFEVTNLEGKFDLAQLVDPKLKSPAAADRARIKALVSLTGIPASPDLFKQHTAFMDFDKIVTAEALTTDDLPELAQRVKDRYDDAALVLERRAEREDGQATALSGPADELNLEDEHDPQVLQSAYNTARDEFTRLTEQARNAQSAREKADKAKALIEQIGEEELETERESLESFFEEADQKETEAQEQLQVAIRRVEDLKRDIKAIQEKRIESRARKASIDRQLAMVADAKKSLETSLVDEPDAREIADAEREMQRATMAIETGTKIRMALENGRKARGHRTAARELEATAVRYREAGKAVDEVLSGCIQCPQLRVESDGKSARLVADHPIRGKSIPYHDLSDGEKWTIAIDIGADQVGEGGLLVISQVGWEGIDGKNRLEIHEHAIRRGVYILTAEAASDPDAPRVIVPTPLGEEPDVAKYASQAAAVEEPVTTPVVPKPRTRAAKAKPVPAKPVAPEVTEDDGDEIPF